MKDWHLHQVEAAIRHHRVDPEQGLHHADASRLAMEHGPNLISAGEGRSVLRLWLEQFQDFMVLVLLAAAVISGWLGDIVDALVILAIVMLNAAIGFAQSWRADRTMAALQQLAAARATVLRGAKIQCIPAAELVPGDIVLLEAGNQIPADLRLIKIAQLQVDESALTGESAAVEKHTRALPPGPTALGERHNMAFKGTKATRGRGIGLVVATGMRTELGKVAALLDPVTSRSTPLQMRLALLGKRLALGVMAICGMIFLVGILRGEEPRLMFMTALSLAVAAIPEALPAIVSVLLALSARRMVSQNVLIRRLPAVETLGSVTVICSDKTGTLTQNRMCVEQILVGEATVIPRSKEAAKLLRKFPSAHPVAEILRAAALCNDARLGMPQGAKKPAVDSVCWTGDPTETALVEAAAAAGLGKTELDRQYPRVDEITFDSQRKRMTTVHQTDCGWVAYTKGAPEAVLPLCRNLWNSEEPGSGKALRAGAILHSAQAMAADGLRVLAFARRTFLKMPSQSGDFVRELSFLGLIGLWDPPRKEAIDAVKACRTAGIVPLMITGDHPATALAIGRRLGIAEGFQSEVLTGNELDMLDEAAFQLRLAGLRIYARVNPAQKIRIVRALQAKGEFVAMTGDGVNDAPALKQAEIGVAMGLGGTDVAREAASLVLLDDNFATIVVAVREGRRIYDNIRKFVRYSLTGNTGEIWLIFLAPFFGLPIPLLPIHILWVNLVTDSLPGIALAAEPAEADIMGRPPRPPQESLFAGMLVHIVGIGLLMALLCLLLYAGAFHSGRSHAQTMVFTALTLSQVIYALAIRSENQSVCRLGLRSNLPLLGTVLLTLLLQMLVVYVPALNVVFRTQPLSALDLMLCVATAALVFGVVEIEKLVRSQKK
ncbi:MAG: cation-translocating P-type ATPase [Verrucomicrobia bacterium]|nr:cation-translocating P-type ATPase [Verrucomicrobiota bacterium]